MEKCEWCGKCDWQYECPECEFFDVCNDCFVKCGQCKIFICKYCHDFYHSPCLFDTSLSSSLLPTRMAM